MNAQAERLSIDQWMVGWNAPDDGPFAQPYEIPGAVEVGPWPDNTGWSDKYSMTVGCCMLERHEMSEWMKIAMMFIDFHTITVRDGVDPQAAHREFLKIGEYRRRISRDTPGAAD